MGGLAGSRMLQTLVLILAMALTALPTGSSETRQIQLADCRLQTPTVAGMPWQQIRFIGRDASPDTQDMVTIVVRVASNSSQRQAGMQHLCPESIRLNPMLFVFDSPERITFHMRNVHAPLDIVFMDADGYIREIRRMTPGETDVRPRQPIAYALELLAGEVDRLGIEACMHMTRAQDR